MMTVCKTPAPLMPHGRDLINVSLLTFFSVSDREPWQAEKGVTSSELCGEGFEGREAAAEQNCSKGDSSGRQ